MPLKLSGAVLHQVMPGCPIPTCARAADIFNELLVKYKMDSADAFHEFIATLAVESAQLTDFDENMNYSAQGMANTWPGRYAIDPKAKIKKPNALALSLVGKPQALANNCYANRMGNGPEASGDGWANRGGGGIQMTGADMYKAYGKWIGISDTRRVAELVRTDLRYAIDSALWVFCIVKGLVDEAINDQFLLITERINGGHIGLPERKAFYARAIQYIV